MYADQEMDDGVNFEEARRLYAHEGPFATVYLVAPSDVEDAVSRLDVEWKNVRRDLAGAGADEASLEALDAEVARGHGGGETLAAVAAGGTVLYAKRLPEPAVRSVGHWGRLPRLGPLFEWSQSFVPHLVVLADREGADIVAFTPGNGTVDATVDGDDEHLRRVAPGGWSQRRFQQRAENTWEHNADKVASSVATLCEEVHAGLVVVAGDVRAVQFLEDALPQRVHDKVRVLENGQRAAGVSVEDIADDVVKQVSTTVAEQTVELLREFREERGQNDRAAEGAAATFEALARAQVGTLLVHDDPDDDRQAWFGPEATHAALDRQVLVDMGVRDPRPERLVDVALRAAAGTSADVRIVPGGGSPRDGIGGILRHADRIPGGAP